MKTITEQINDIKSSLKDMIGQDTPTQTIEALASIDKQLDSIVETTKAMEAEKTSLKDQIVSMAKGISFKPIGDEDQLSPEPMDMDSAIEQTLADLIKEKK